MKTIYIRIIYFIIIFSGAYVVFFKCFTIQNNVLPLLSLLVYIFIFKPTCDAIFLILVHKYKIKELFRKYPFWSYETRMDLYFRNR